MAQLRSAIILALALGVILLAYPPRAQAYLDPGTGSYLIQVLLAGLLAGGVAVRLFWRNITGFFRRIFPRQSAHEEPPHDQ
jgi:hypothetical protein